MFNAVLNLCSLCGIGLVGLALIGIAVSLFVYVWPKVRRIGTGIVREFLFWTLADQWREESGPPTEPGESDDQPTPAHNPEDTEHPIGGEAQPSEKA